jgi:conjugal transfer pilus assembly protein TraW
VRRAAILVVATLASVGWLPSAHALDLGKVGPTYGIAEPHLLADIDRRLREKERSGELGKLIEEARVRGIDAVRSPEPVSGLSVAPRARTFYVDPSFTLDRNVVDAQGRLMYAAGTRKNPLEIVSLSKRLLFFDARDARQVAHARELVSSNGMRVKAILTGGSYLDLMKAWHTPVFYDQQGVLTRRLGLRHVPAIVSQEGQLLRVDEVALP